MNAFPRRLTRITRIEGHDFVAVPHTANAQWVQDDQGRAWVCKREEETGFQALMAEAICTLLGKAIGAPVPDGAVYVGPDGQAWLSARVEDAAHWAPDQADYLVNLADAGAVLALDAIVLNDDRHSRNILLVPDPDELHVRFYGIDAGNARVGFVTDFVGSAPDALPALQKQARGLPLDAMRDGALAAALRAEQIDPDLLREFVLEGCQLVQEPTVDALVAALDARCRRAVALTARYIDALGTLP